MQYHPFNQSELITSYNQESYKLSKDTEILLSPFGVCLGLSAYMHYSYFSQTHTDTSSNTINPPSLFTTFEQFKNDTSIFDNPDRCTTLISQIQNHEFSTVQNPYIHSSEYQTQRLYNLINTCLYSYATWSCHLLEFASETINMLHDMSIPNFDAKNFKMLNLQEPNSRLQTMQHCSIVQTHQINYLLTQSSWNTFFDLQSPNCPFVAGGSYIINSQPFDSIETKDQNIAMLHVMAVIIDRSGSILFFDPSSMLVCDLKNALLTETQSKKIQGALGLRIMTNNEPDHSSDSVRDMTMLQITSISDARTHFARLEESIFIINRMNECVYNLKDIDPLNLSSALLQKAIGFSLLNDDPIVFEKFAYTFLSKQNNLTIEQAREQFEQAILTMPWCFEMHLLPPNILSSVFEKIWNKEHSLAAFLHYPKIIKNSGAPDFIYFKTLKNFCKDKKIPFVFELSSKEFTQISVTEWQLIFEQLSHIAESDMVLKRLKSQFRKNHAIGIWPFITLKTVSERDEYFKKLSDAELIEALYSYLCYFKEHIEQEEENKQKHNIPSITKTLYFYIIQRDLKEQFNNQIKNYILQQIGAADRLISVDKILNILRYASISSWDISDLNTVFLYVIHDLDREKSMCNLKNNNQIDELQAKFNKFLLIYIQHHNATVQKEMESWIEESIELHSLDSLKKVFVFLNTNQNYFHQLLDLTSIKSMIRSYTPAQLEDLCSIGVNWGPLRDTIKESLLSYANLNARLYTEFSRFFSYLILTDFAKWNEKDCNAFIEYFLTQLHNRIDDSVSYKESELLKNSYKKFTLLCLQNPNTLCTNGILYSSLQELVTNYSLTTDEIRTILLFLNRDKKVCFDFIHSRDFRWHIQSKTDLNQSDSLKEIFSLPLEWSGRYDGMSFVESMILDFWSDSEDYFAVVIDHMIRHTQAELTSDMIDKLMSKSQAYPILENTLKFCQEKQPILFLSRKLKNTVHCHIDECSVRLKSMIFSEPQAVTRSSTTPLSKHFS